MSTGSMRPRAGFNQEAVTVQSPRPYPHGSIYKEDVIIGNGKTTWRIASFVVVLCRRMLMRMWFLTGAYGTVYKATDLNDPTREVALKKVRIPISEDGIPVSILREISLVRQVDRFQHPNIIRFLDVCHGPRNAGEVNPHLILYLVFEFIDMDLSKYIQTADAEALSPQKIKVTGACSFTLKRIQWNSTYNASKLLHSHTQTAHVVNCFFFIVICHRILHIKFWVELTFCTVNV